MDLIERWFGISPDGGSGSLEIIFVILTFLIFAAPMLPLRRVLYSLAG
jgi:hypothetical protein